MVTSLKTAPKDLLVRYERLPPEHRLLLGVKSLVFLPTNKNEFSGCMTRAKLPSPDGKIWTAGKITETAESLSVQGFLEKNLTCVPELRQRAAADALATEHKNLILHALRGVFPVPVERSGYYTYLSQAERDSLFRHLRLAVLANDEDEFAVLSARIAKLLGPRYPEEFVSVAFATQPLDPAWLASRAPTIRSAALQARLGGWLTNYVPGPDLPEVLAYARTLQGKEGYRDFSDLQPRHDLLAGQWDAVREAVKAQNKPTGALSLALEGAMAFLDGRNEAALPLFREALKALRKELGRRKVFLHGELGLFFLMALLRANDAKLYPEIQNGIDAALAEQAIKAHDPGYSALQILLWVVQGLEAKARETMSQLNRTIVREPLSVACVALAEYALETTVSRDREVLLREQFQALKDVFPVVARISAEILAEVGDMPAGHKAWLDKHPMVSFTRLIQTSQPWERALASLDAFLDTGEGAADAGKTVRKTKRLAWFLDPDTQEIDVVEQSPKGRDGWTDGRPVAMKRLHEQDPRLDYLTVQDRSALRAVRKHTGSGWYNEDSYEFDASRAILALVGHPTVFDARRRSQPMDLVSYPMELLVTEQRDGYRIALSHSADHPTVFLEPETPSRWRVVEFPQKLLGLQEILGRKGLVVPAAARDQVIAMARRNNPALPIRAELPEFEQPGQEGQSAPVVQLVPYGEGLKLNLLVRPFGVEGTAFVAGLGGRSVLATIDGQQRRATRDLPRELAERSALIEGCPTLRDRCGTDTHEVILEDLEGSLDLLLELRAYTGPSVLEWPEGRTMRVSAVTAGAMKLRVAQDRDWFNVEGTIGLDEDQVLEMRFLLERLDKAQGRFVALGEGRFVALTRQMQLQLHRLAAVSEPHRTGRRVHALGAPALEAVLEDAGGAKVDAAWKRHVARIRAAEGWTPVLPPTLQAELRDYQVEGFVWLSRLARWGAGACLADDMGLGKTVQAIAVMLDQAGEGPCLVVAPTSVLPNWESEIARFAPTLATHRLAAVAERPAQIAALGPRDVLVCTYGMLHQAAEALGARRWQMAVLDEAQAIKNAETQRARAIQTLQAEFRLALTGTPVENYLDELWSLFSFVNPGVLGSRDGFQKRFARPIERDKDPNARQALRSLIRPFLLRRTKAAVLSELPPRTEQTIAVEMTETERAFYEALRQQSLEKLAAADVPEGRRKIQILAEITRLRRACCNPALIDPAAAIPSGKLTAFMDLVEELIRNRHKALVFSQFVGHLELVRAALDAKGIRYEYLDGGTSSAERERRVAAFQAGGADLFLISLRAGGTGLNLTAADYVVHLDPWWNPAVEDQASDRAHRIGQERPVTIYRLIMQDSIEERILSLHRDKRDLATELLEGTETTARLSEEALLDLIRV